VDNEFAFNPSFTMFSDYVTINRRAASLERLSFKGNKLYEFNGLGNHSQIDIDKLIVEPYLTEIY
jgi:hypothetical protein